VLACEDDRRRGPDGHARSGRRTRRALPRRQQAPLLSSR
jgi:hypothetical protein